MGRKSPSDIYSGDDSASATYLDRGSLERLALNGRHAHGLTAGHFCTNELAYNYGTVNDQGPCKSSKIQMKRLELQLNCNVRFLKYDQKACARSCAGKRWPTTKIESRNSSCWVKFFSILIPWKRRKRRESCYQRLGNVLKASSIELDAIGSLQDPLFRRIWVHRCICYLINRILLRDLR